MKPRRTSLEVGASGPIGITAGCGDGAWSQLDRLSEPV